MSLNGYQRIFAVIAALWLVVAAQFSLAVGAGSDSIALKVGAFLAGWAIPLAVLYVGGLVVAWVVRGLRQAAPR
jgi:hypothetical protein